MTDNEIIKALECCTKDDCDKCPNDFGNCYANLAGYALDLINRQKAEKEALIAGQETLQKYIAEQKAENEHLQDLLVKNNAEIAKQETEIERLNQRVCREVEKLRRLPHGNNRVRCRGHRQPCKRNGGW